MSISAIAPIRDHEFDDERCAVLLLSQPRRIRLIKRCASASSIVFLGVPPRDPPCRESSPVTASLLAEHLKAFICAAVAQRERTIPDSCTSSATTSKIRYKLHQSRSRLTKRKPFAAALSLNAMEINFEGSGGVARSAGPTARVRATLGKFCHLPHSVFVGDTRQSNLVQSAPFNASSAVHDRDQLVNPLPRIINERGVSSSNVVGTNVSVARTTLPSLTSHLTQQSLI